MFVLQAFGEGNATGSSNLKGNDSLPSVIQLTKIKVEPGLNSSEIAAPPETMVTPRSSSFASTSKRCAQQSVNTPVASSSRNGRHSRTNRYVARKSTGGRQVRPQISRKSAVVNQTRPTLVKKKSVADMAGPSTSTAADVRIKVERQDNYCDSSEELLENSQKKQLIGSDKRTPTNSTLKMGTVSSSNLSKPIVEIDLTSGNEMEEEPRPSIQQVTKLKFLLVVPFD